MATNVATWRSFLGIAKQPTAGTPVAATDYLAITGDPKPVDVINYLSDKAWRGSAVDTYGKIAGPRKSSMSIDGNVDLSTIGYPLQGVLPDLVVTGTAAPYTSVFSTKNSGDSQQAPYTITDYDGLDPRQYSDAKFTELMLSFTGDNLVTFKSKVESWASVIAGSTPTPSFSTAQPLAGWGAVVTIGGSAVLNVNVCEITIKRGVDVIDTVDGVQDPYRIWQGPVSVTGKLDFVRETDLEFNRYLQNTQVALDIKLTQGTSSLTLHSTSTAFITGANNRGKSYSEINTTFECLGNVTDTGASLGYSPIKATLVNAKASGTYA